MKSLEINEMSELGLCGGLEESEACLVLKALQAPIILQSSYTYPYLATCWQHVSAPELLPSSARVADSP